jgi:palmitoyltransferase
MDKSVSYASIDIGSSRASGKYTNKPRLSQKLRKSFQPSNPDQGLAAFKCQSRFLWSLIIISAFVIQYDTHMNNKNQMVTLFISLFIIYEIYMHWRLVKLKNPIFNDGVWFDVPPRGWDFCVECHHHRPPRCHHCVVCDTCIMKRNHHCFFTGACIGLGNQKNFILFLTWTSIALIYGMYMVIPLVWKYYIPFELSLVSIVGYLMPPFYIFLPLFGHSTWTGTFFIFLVASYFCSLVFTVPLLINHLNLIARNLTDYEKKENIQTYSKRGIIFNLQLIFGPNLFIMPLVLFWPKLNVRSREADCIYGRPQYTKVM